MQEKPIPEPSPGSPPGDNGNQAHQPMREERDRLNLYFMIFLLVATASLFLFMVRMFFVPVLLALTLATIFYPFYGWILRVVGGRRNLAALLGCIIVLLGLLLPIYAIGRLLTSQLIIFYRYLESEQLLTAEGLQGVLQTLEGTRIYRWIVGLNINWQEGLRNILSTLGNLLTFVIEKTSAGVIGLVTGIVITLFTLYYFFRDGPTLVKQFLYLSPLRAEYEERIMQRFILISRATINGTLLVGLIQGAIGALTLLVFGVQTWVLWGVVIIILAIIPMIGPGVVMIPAGIVMILGGRIFSGIAVIAISILIVGTVDNLIRPRLVGSGARMHDLMIFFSTLGGIAVFGVLGFIIGPVIAAFFSSLLTIYGMEFKESLQPAQAVPDLQESGPERSSPEPQPASDEEQPARPAPGRPSRSPRP
jgi:predicted PurR-regulated permease PerM